MRMEKAAARRLSLTPASHRIRFGRRCATESATHAITAANSPARRKRPSVPDALRRQVQLSLESCTANRVMSRCSFSTASLITVSYSRCARAGWLSPLPAHGSRPPALRRCRQKGAPKDICDKSEAIRAYAWQKRDKRLLKHPTETELRTKRPRRISDRSGQRRTRSRCGGIGNQYRRAVVGGFGKFSVAKSV